MWVYHAFASLEPVAEQTQTIQNRNNSVSHQQTHVQGMRTHSLYIMSLLAHGRHMVYTWYTHGIQVAYTYIQIVYEMV